LREREDVHWLTTFNLVWSDYSLNEISSHSEAGRVWEKVTMTIEVTWDWGEEQCQE
jgi:hypothetical protein